MNRIEKKFIELKEKKEKALICFLTCGDPNLKITENLVMEIADKGADIIELGIPFSDPMADGPVIQAASMRALANGTTIKGIFNCIKKIRAKTETPIVLMTYYNPVNRYGVENFASDAAKSGADGVIITDLPPEESASWKSSADSNNLSTIFLLAPTSNDERIKHTTQVGTGFIYCVSRTGVTGTQDDAPADLNILIEKIKSYTAVPVVIGFGISKPEHVANVSKYADGAVVGSALVKIIADHISKNDFSGAVKSAGNYVFEMKSATK